MTSSISGSGGIGFVADARRMNVAITRARCACWIVGSAQALGSDANWAALVAHARDTGAFFDAPALLRLLAVVDLALE